MIEERVPGSERRRNPCPRRNLLRRRFETFDGGPVDSSRPKRRSGP
jgi:hypothetical protein